MSPKSAPRWESEMPQLPTSQASTLLKYRDAMSIASKLNGAPDGSWTYYPKDVGLGRGIVGILDHLGREIGFL